VVQVRHPRGRPSRRKKQLPTDQAILQAAMVLFMERGYRAVTIDAVAEAAGVSKPSVYYHFADKGSLFVAVGHLVFARAREATQAILSRPSSFQKQLQDIMEVVFSLPQPFTAFDAMMHEAATELTPEQMADLRREEQSLAELVEQAVFAAARRGEIDAVDPKLAAHAFLALLRVGQARDATGGRVFPRADVTAKTLVQLFWHGIGRGSPPKARQ